MAANSSITIINCPTGSGTRLWNCILYQAGNAWMWTPGYISIANPWLINIGTSQVSVTVDIDIVDDYGFIYQRHGVSEVIQEGINYNWNCLTNRLELPDGNGVPGGTITQKELEYNQSRAAIPATGIPSGLRGLVHIWGRNDYDVNVTLGISWVVRKPNGVIAETYDRWEGGGLTWTPPGGIQEFIGDRFDLNMEGTWTINVSLLGWPDVLLDNYSGTLCVVAAGIPDAVFSLFKITDYLKG